MRRRRVSLLLVSLFIVAVAWGGVAGADTRTVDDGNDAAEGLDLKSASHGHAPDGRLRHRIVSYNRIGGAERTLYLEIVADGHTYEFLPNGEVWKDTRDYPTGPSGHAAVSRPDERTIVYTFRKAVIGNPSAYRWRVRSVPMSTNSDRIPNTGRVTHDI